MGQRRFGPEVPKLSNRKWEDVAPYLEEFLRRLNDANDETQESLDALEVGVEIDDTLPQRPAPHTHSVLEINGLEQPFERRPPTPHTHRVEDVVAIIGDKQLILASQIFGG